MDTAPRVGDRARPHRVPRDPDPPVRRSVRGAALRSVRQPPLTDLEAGWTFLEVIIVIAIILILTSAVGVAAFRSLDRARQATARTQIEAFSLALQAYAMDCRRYPTREQGLEALWEKPILEPVPAGWAGPYVDRKIPGDPWGSPYEYAVPGPQGLPFGIRSLGADGTEGGEGNDRDVSSWEG